MAMYYCDECNGFIREVVAGVEFYPPFAIWGVFPGKSASASAIFCSSACAQKWVSRL